MTKDNETGEVLNTTPFSQQLEGADQFRNRCPAVTRGIEK